MIKKTLLLITLLFLGYILVSCEAKTYQVVELPSITYEYLEDYEINLNSVEIMDSFISPIGETTIHATNGTHFIKLGLTFFRKVVPEPSDDITINLDFFTLKDHDSISSSHHFDDIDGAIDYSGSKHTDLNKIMSGDTREIVLYFELPEDITLENSPIYLEVDFFKSKLGIDIAITEITTDN